MEVPQFLRANPSINQYAFSGCYANDAPNSGHCRPQIDSAQGWSSNVQNAGWMSIDLQGATRVAGILLQVSDSKARTANLNYGAPEPQLTGPQQQLRLQPVAFQASGAFFCSCSARLNFFVCSLQPAHAQPSKSQQNSIQ